jgi:RNA polymerase sigma-70 factor (ECF subfamily)
VSEPRPSEGPPDDGLLVERLRGGDAGAFREIVRRFHPTMLRVARAMVKDAAEDIVQETWAAVIDGLDRFERRSSLRTWVFRILTNRASSWARQARRAELSTSLREELSADEAALDPERFTRMGNWSTPPAAWAERSAEDIVVRMETGAALLRLLDSLPTAQRLVVTLRDMDGLSSTEVCEILDVSEANQRVLLHRGRSKLRAAMESYLSSE